MLREECMITTYISEDDENDESNDDNDDDELTDGKNKIGEIIILLLLNSVDLKFYCILIDIVLNIIHIYWCGSIIYIL